MVHVMEQAQYVGKSVLRRLCHGATCKLDEPGERGGMGREGENYNNEERSSSRERAPPRCAIHHGKGWGASPG